MLFVLFRPQHSLQQPLLAVGESMTWFYHRCEYYSNCDVDSSLLMNENGGAIIDIKLLTSSSIQLILLLPMDVWMLACCCCLPRMLYCFLQLCIQSHFLFGWWLRKKSCASVLRNTFAHSGILCTHTMYPGTSTPSSTLSSEEEGQMIRRRQDGSNAVAQVVPQ